MAITYKIWDFPNVAVSKMLYHAPGAAAEGGYTSGSARMLSPEPGGRGMLEIQPSMHNEWDDPVYSWLMSKINGEIMRVRLARTPQVLTSRSMNVLKDYAPDYARHDIYGKPDRIVVNDLVTTFASSALEGSNEVTIDMSPLGNILRPGHVFGHGNYCYFVDEIDYAANGIATVTSKVPFRADIAANDTVLFRPYFLGTIINAQEIRASYDAEMNGHHQPGMIVLSESIV